MHAPCNLFLPETSPEPEPEPEPEPGLNPRVLTRNARQIPPPPCPIVVLQQQLPTSLTVQPRPGQPTGRQREEERPLREPRPAELGVHPLGPGKQYRRQPREPVHAARKGRDPERVARHLGRRSHQERPPRQKQRRGPQRRAQPDRLAAVEPGRWGNATCSSALGAPTFVLSRRAGRQSKLTSRVVAIAG